MVLIIESPKKSKESKSKNIKLSKKDKILLQLMVFGSDDMEVARILNVREEKLPKLKSALKKKLCDKYRVCSWNETIKICFEKKIIDIQDFMHADVKQHANFYTKKIFSQCFMNKKPTEGLEDKMTLRIKDFITSSIHEMKIAEIKNRYV